MDSDSDDNISNAFTCNLKSMNVSVKGPNLSTYRNNNMRGPMRMPLDFMQDTRSVYDHRSMNSRRDTSPRSICSMGNFQPRNFMSYRDLHGMGSESMFSFQSRNPTGLTNFASAIDIASSLQYNQFNNKDVKIIEGAFKKFLKKIQNLYSDSEDQGDDLSLSDDDDGDRSMRSSIFNENMPRHRSTKAHSTRSRISRQKSVCKRNPVNFTKKTSRNTCLPNNDNNLPNHSQIGENVQPLQKHRFENRYLLPSQRFNKSIAAQPIIEKISNVQSTVQCNGNIGQKNDSNDVVPNITPESDNETTLSEAIVSKNGNRKEESFKRKLEDDESTAIANRKRAKLSPIQKIPKNNLKKNHNTKAVDKGETSGFSFVKPTFPIKKFSRSKIKETPNDSAQTPVVATSQLNISPDVDESVNKVVCEPTINSTSDAANTTSFIKRKLFTQTLDITENKNISCDSVSSPQIVSSSIIQKEKTKPRKLGSSLPCLDRDVTEETNLIPLIHKIVPLSQINSTAQNNKAVGGNKKDVRKECDVASVVSGCNGAGGSETYTDEDIFEQNAADCTKDNSKTNDRTEKNIKNCQVVLEKGNPPITSSNSTLTEKYLLAKKSAANKQNSSGTKGNEKKSTIFRSNFWDTDFESDIECQNIQKKVPESPKINKGNGMKSTIFRNTFLDTDFESAIEGQNVQRKFPESPKINKENLKEKEELRSEHLTKSSDTNNRTVTHSDTAVTSNISRLTNLRVRSHRAPKKIMCCAKSEISSNKGAGTNIKINFQHKDKSLDKNITNNRQTGDTEDIVINRSRRAGSVTQIGKNKQSDGKAGKLTKTTTTAAKTKKDSKPSESDTSQSMQQSPLNNKTKTRKVQVKPNKVAKKIINMQEIESDVSFSLLDTSVRTRSRTKAITELMNLSSDTK